MAATRSARRTSSSRRRSPTARSTSPRLTASPSSACCPTGMGEQQVNLSSAFNRTGIVVDGTRFRGGGLDRHGHDLSSNLLGTSLTAGGVTFDLGPAGAADVVSAAGQTIDLPAGNDAALKLLATAVNGNQASRTFTVTYTDGTTARFRQSISNWATPKRYAGESTALSTDYRDTSRGRKQAGRFHVYEYTFTLDPTKTVRSLTLPKDAERRGARRHACPRGHDAREPCSDLAWPPAGPASTSFVDLSSGDRYVFHQQPFAVGAFSEVQHSR